MSFDFIVIHIRFLQNMTGKTVLDINAMYTIPIVPAFDGSVQLCFMKNSASRSF
jgi:hypothetical protein